MTTSFPTYYDMCNGLNDFIYALYLFNRDDLRTTIIPVTVFAQALATQRLWSSLALVIPWVWIHLLLVTVSNQSWGKSPEEDAINKPKRPIPAQRISLASSRVLRWLLIPIISAFSYHFNTVWATAYLSVLTTIYNEGNGHSHWLTKNGLCALGYAALEYGATIVVEGSDELTTNQTSAVIASALIMATTIQAQDFKDSIGDAVFGRKTLPLMFPSASRISMPVLLLAWSVALALFSEVHIVIRCVLVALGLLAGNLFFVSREAETDKTADLIYHIWLGTAHFALSKLNVGA